MDFDFNRLLQQIGDFGVYQILLCVVLVLPSALICALIYFAQFFIILVPDHWCSIEQISAVHATNATLSELKNLYIPYEFHDGRKIFNRCYINDEPNFNYKINANVSVHKCANVWHYNYANLYPTMATEANWVCDDNRQPYNIQTVFYIGTSIGCLIFGYISDRFGRKPSIIGSCLIACIAGMLTAFVNDFWSFAILRFFVGASIIPLSEDPYVLSLEYIGADKRTLSIIAWTTGYITASTVCPWIAYWLKSWRMLCIVTSAPLLCFIIAAKWIPESASWLLSRGRKEEALRILEKVAKINGKKMPAVASSPVSEELLSPASTAGIISNNNSGKGKNLSESHKIGAKHIFILPRMRRRSLLLAVCWFFLFSCYHTNTQNTSNLGADIYSSFTYGALVEVPASVIVYFVLDILGRKWPMFLSMTLAGVVGLLTLTISKTESASTMYLIVALIMRVCLATEYNIIIQYSTEVYPTVLRGRALAFLRFMGTLGLYLSPSIVYLALDNQSWPFAITGMMALVVAFCSIFLPETMHQELPHSLQEGEDFGKQQPIFNFPCIH